MARKRYNKGNRLDMRQGGRVALARGRRPIEQEEVNIPPVKPVKKKPVKSRNPRDFQQQKQIGGKKGVGAPRTPEELQQQEQLSYVAGRGPTTPQPQVSPEFQRKNDPESLKLQGGPKYQAISRPQPQVQQQQAPQLQAEEEMVNQSVLNQPQISPVTGEEMDFEVPAIGANEDTMQIASSEPKGTERQGGRGRRGGPWWRQLGFDSAQAAIEAGYSYNASTGQWTQSADDEEEDVDDDDSDDGDGDDDGGTTTTETTDSFSARELAEQAASGAGPQGAAIIPDAVKVGGYQTDEEGNPILDEEGNPIPVVRDMETTEFAALTEEQKAAAGAAAMPAAEVVTTGTAAPDVQAPEDVETAKMEAAQVTTAPVIDAQTGQVSPEAIAEMQDATLTMAAEGVNVDQGKAAAALAEAAKGTLSPEAKAEAAKVAGTDLPRVLRAKKQLRKAGLTEDQIKLIGNDPELLEDELMNYSEEERGMIAGLPEEALVSTQLNALLEGVESGEIPAFARPAMAAVEQMLAQRGMSASTVGRDALINAMIQSAIPLAQSNAQSIKESVMQQRTIEAQAEQMNAQMRQQTALSNADKVFNMDMANLNNEQQTRLSNSKFLQTVALTDASNEQQAVMQNAASMASLDLAELDANTRLAAQNAQAFLSMDMANLNNKQQTEMLRAQQTQQRLLSNQAATNAAAQFNAASENETNRFMANLSAQIDLSNAARKDAMSQFNATQANAAEARRVGIEADVNKFNASLVTQVSQFNANQEFARNQWMAQNAAAVEASNVQWRRQVNVANTAAQNTINMQNAQNAFNMSQTAMSFLWQEMRDQADYNFRESENDKNRIAQLVNTAIASDPTKYSATASLNTLIGAIIGDITG